MLRFHRLDHGRRRQRADVRRRRRRLRWCASRRRRLLAVPLAARHRRAAFPPRRLQAQGGRARRQDALAARRGAAERTSTRSTPRATRLPLRQAFPEGGYYVLGCDFETPREIRARGRRRRRSATARSPRTATPTRSRSRCRWAAASSSSIRAPTPTTRSRAGGNYFRGTAAHNTLRVDGLDQSEPGGNFMWLRKARAGCSLWLSSRRRRTASRAGTTATCASPTR